ncbi:MAG: FmdB family zinc ribbon protein [Terracidiphilus sp.]
MNTLPLYAYRCTQCGHRFEKIQNFSSKPESVCRECGGELVRPLTAPRLHFKGSGFYVNDYPGKSDKPSMDSTPAEIKTPCGGSCGAACPAVAAASTASTAESPKN